MLLPNVYRLGHSLGVGLGSWLAHPPSSVLNLILVWIETLWTFPMWYKDWWFKLVVRDPIHVVVETTLLSFVIYMIIISRNKDYKFRREEKLSLKEQEELLYEWKTTGRASLAPNMNASTNNSKMEEESTWAVNTSTNNNTAANFLISSMKGRTMDIVFPSSTTMDGDIKKKKNVTNKKDNNKKEQKSNNEKKKIQLKEEEEYDQKMTVLNFSTNDFLGLACSSEVKDASLKALDKYGCGSCGPRGFYGTIDVHLELEQRMANFVETEQAILYSDGASTISSTIAAFCKRGDLVIVDSGVYEPIVTGVTLSRANVIWFQHNDMDDLRRVLLQVQKKDRELGRKPNDQRRFIVVEGLYKNSGTICPLAELVKLKHEFKYRLILDETHSFGTLSPRGLLEFSEQRYMYDAEIVMIGLETTLGGIGGVTVGNEEVVDHQRLSGAGYCFSASSPPFTATAAMAALSQLEQSLVTNGDDNSKKHKSLTEELQANLVMFHDAFKQSKILSANFIRTSDERSPLVYLELKNVAPMKNNDENAKITEKESNSAAISNCNDLEDLVQRMANLCLMESSVAMVPTAPRHDHAVSSKLGNKHYPPSIRVTLSAAHKKEDIQQVVLALEQACQCLLPLSTAS